MHRHTSLLRITSITFGRPSAILFTFSQGMPFSVKYFAVPSVARSSNPSEESFFPTSMICSLSATLSERETRIFFFSPAFGAEGSSAPAPSWLLKYASGKLSESPSTSPVERISGPRTGSTLGNFVKGNTASFTPWCGITFSVSLRSARDSPSMSRVARRAICVLHTLDTSGTVRDARGLASITKTFPSSIAYCMFIRPHT